MLNVILALKPIVKQKKNFDGKIFYLLLRPMKIVPNIFLLVLLMVSASATAIPSNGPPPPGIPPPGLPIDGDVVSMAVFAALFGLYKIYKSRLFNKKTPV